MEIDNTGDLFHAAQSGDLNRLHDLLSDPACVVDALDETKQWAALHYSADSGHPAACELLLKHGGDANVRSGELIKDGDLRRDWYWEPGHTPLMLAARKGHVEVVEILIQLGASVLLEDSTSWTPLHAACVCNNGKIIELLLAEGATTDVSCSFRHFDEELGWHFMLTPLHVAANCGSVEAVQRLLEHGATIDKCWATRRTPLIYAAARGYADVISILCKHKADPNAREHKHGYGAFLDATALHYAARNGHANAVATLLACGAEPSAIESNSGQTALEMAEQQGHQIIAQMILQKMSG